MKLCIFELEVINSKRQLRRKLRYVQACTQQQKLRKIGEIVIFAKITKFK